MKLSLAVPVPAMNIEIGAYEAKTRLSELLRSVEQGQRYTITHRGRPLAELVPYTPSADERSSGLARLRALAQLHGNAGLSLAPDEVRAARDWGRR